VVGVLGHPVAQGLALSGDRVVLLGLLIRGHAAVVSRARVDVGIAVVGEGPAGVIVRAVVRAVVRVVVRVVVCVIVGAVVRAVADRVRWGREVR
jgi:FAD/FMN-containing dehydrogenase